MRYRLCNPQTTALVPLPDAITFLSWKTDHTGLALRPWVPNPSFQSRESCSSRAPLIAFDSRKCIWPGGSWRAWVA